MQTMKEKYESEILVTSKTYFCPRKVFVCLFSEQGILSWSAIVIGVGLQSTQNFLCNYAEEKHSTQGLPVKSINALGKLHSENTHSPRTAHTKGRQGMFLSAAFFLCLIGFKNTQREERKLVDTWTEIQWLIMFLMEMQSLLQRFTLQTLLCLALSSVCVWGGGVSRGRTGKCFWVITEGLWQKYNLQG